MSQNITCGDVNIMQLLFPSGVVRAPSTQKPISQTRLLSWQSAVVEHVKSCERVGKHPDAASARRHAYFTNRKIPNPRGAPPAAASTPPDFIRSDPARSNELHRRHRRGHGRTWRHRGAAV